MSANLHVCQTPTKPHPQTVQCNEVILEVKPFPEYDHAWKHPVHATHNFVTPTEIRYTSRITAPSSNKNQALRARQLFPVCASFPPSSL